MPRLTADQWAAARIKWEADPTVTFTELGKALGVSEAAVRQRAKSESWMKTGAMRGIVERAHIKADAKLRPNFDGEVQKAGAIEAAEDIRADVIERHRADWAGHRQHFKTGDIAADFDVGKSAKISAEMLLIRQKGERAAYGLDDTATTQVPQGPDWTALVRQKAGEA